MQALKDAGIVLIVILLLVSVRVSPVGETDDATDTVGLTPQTEAAAPSTLGAAVQPVHARTLPAPQKKSAILWVLSSDDEFDSKPDAETIEYCTEILFQPQAAAEETQVAKVLPCSA